MSALWLWLGACECAVVFACLQEVCLVVFVTMCDTVLECGLVLVTVSPLRTYDRTPCSWRCGCSCKCVMGAGIWVTIAVCPRWVYGCVIL